MLRLPLECMLMVAYAVVLALMAFLLEWASHHAHRRAQSASTVGFTYHPSQDIWKCPRDQHLFPVFSDVAKGVVVYRATAAACNICPSKPACTDSSHGREIAQRTLGEVEHGMTRFHRGLSLTLLTLASLMLLVELFRAGGTYAKVLLASMLVVFCVLIQRLFRTSSWTDGLRAHRQTS